MEDEKLFYMLVKEHPYCSELVAFKLLQPVMAERFASTLMGETHEDKEYFQDALDIIFSVFIDFLFDPDGRQNNMRNFHLAIQGENLQLINSVFEELKKMNFSNKEFEKLYFDTIIELQKSL